jgi:hypothetical protein
MTIFKRGGMWFWRLGPLGGSFYVSHKSTNQRAFDRDIRAMKRASVRRMARRFARLPLAARYA